MNKKKEGKVIEMNISVSCWLLATTHLLKVENFLHMIPILIISCDIDIF